MCIVSMSRALPVQVVGVFPGARMSDGTEEELDVDVELLNWEERKRRSATIALKQRRSNWR